MLNDSGAAIFGEAFARAIAAGETPQQAQDLACQATLAITEQFATLDTGHSATVQMYELHVDPQDALRVHQKGQIVIQICGAE